LRCRRSLSGQLALHGRPPRSSPRSRPVGHYPFCGNAGVPPLDISGVLKTRGLLAVGCPALPSHRGLPRGPVLAGALLPTRRCGARLRLVPRRCCRGVCVVAPGSRRDAVSSPVRARFDVPTALLRRRLPIAADPRCRTAARRSESGRMRRLQPPCQENG
jgi:hypothetical protein